MFSFKTFFALVAFVVVASAQGIENLGGAAGYLGNVPGLTNLTEVIGSGPEIPGLPEVSDFPIRGKRQAGLEISGPLEVLDIPPRKTIRVVDYVSIPVAPKLPASRGVNSNLTALAAIETPRITTPTLPTVSKVGV